LKVEHEAGELYNAPWGLYKVSVVINDEIVVIEAEALLNATGRAPNVYNLGLENVSCYLFDDEIQVPKTHFFSVRLTSGGTIDWEFILMRCFKLLILISTLAATVPLFTSSLTLLTSKLASLSAMCFLATLTSSPIC